MTHRRIVAASVVAVALVTAGVTGWVLARDEPRSAKRWVVPDGGTRRFSAEELLPLDSFACSDGPGVAFVPAPGEGVWNTAGITVTTAIDGTLTVECERSGRDVTGVAASRDARH
jgi:hypothetical protein